MNSAKYPASAVVLAGGDSRRLGRDKALIRMADGRTLIDGILAKLDTLSPEAILVTNHPERYAHLQAKVVEDSYPGKGSLGGIYSGLLASSYPRSLVVGCDMPLLNERLLRYMLTLAPDYDVVVPGVFREKGGATAKEEGIHPLHAVYSKACLEPIKGLLDVGDLRIIAFYPQVRVRCLEAEEIDLFDPQRLSLFNINSPSDLKQAQKLGILQEE